MVESIFSLLMLIPIVVLYFGGIIAVLAAFYMPFDHWNRIKESRIGESIRRSKWDNFQEIFLIIVVPLILTTLGALYLIKLLDFNF